MSLRSLYWFPIRAAGVVVAATLACVPGGSTALAADAEPECAGSAPQVHPSPDGRFQASVQEQACATASGAAAAAIVVIVAPSATPDAGIRALTIAVPRSREDWPLPRWRDAGKLDLWVPNLARVLGRPPASFQGIEIELHYCQDNPADRQAVIDQDARLKQWMRDTTEWARQRKESPGSEGPRPLRPQEPRIPPGRCDPAQLR